MTLGEILKKSEEFLARKGIENAKGDARRLLAHGLEIAPLQVLLQMERPMTEAELAQLRTLVARRGQNEPLQHVLGAWAFRHLELKVDGRALVPRPETELIVDLALARLSGVAPRVHEVGVGTGAIGLSIKRECPQAQVSGSDISSAALALCSENARTLGIWFPLFQGDLAQAIAPETLDLLISNPPYIATGELAGLSVEVQHDPKLSLDGGPDGLAALRSLVEQAADRLKPGGWLIMEHGWDQGETTRAFCGTGWTDVATAKDLAGQDRFLVARRPA